MGILIGWLMWIPALLVVSHEARQAPPRCEPMTRTPWYCIAHTPQVPPCQLRRGEWVC